MQAEEILESAKKEAEALRNSAAAARAEAERRLDGLNAQQAETAQLHASLSAQGAAQLQREVNLTAHLAGSPGGVLGVWPCYLWFWGDACVTERMNLHRSSGIGLQSLAALQLACAQR